MCLSTQRHGISPGEMGRAKVAHGTSGMTGKQGVAQSLGALVGKVQDAGNMPHHKDATLLPLLDGEVLNVNMPGPRGGLIFVHHCNGGQIVNVQWRGTLRRKK